MTTQLDHHITDKAVIRSEAYLEAITDLWMEHQHDLTVAQADALVAAHEAAMAADEALTAFRLALRSRI